MKKSILMSAVASALMLGSLQANAADMPESAKASGCTACHAIDKKIVGPPWADVAKKYSADDKAMLIDKVKKGGKGNWTSVTGGMPMPPYSPRVNDDTINELVDFILGLK